MEDEDEGGTAAAMCAGETWLSRFVGDITCYRGMGSILQCCYLCKKLS